MKISDVVQGTVMDQVIRHILSSPSDEVFTVKELSEKFSVPESTIKSSRRIKQYIIKYGTSTYYGNAAARAAFAAEENKDEN